MKTVGSNVKETRGRADRTTWERRASPQVPTSEDIDALQVNLRSPDPSIHDAAHAVMDALLPFDAARDTRASRAYVVYRDAVRKARIRGLSEVSLKAVLDVAAKTNEGQMVAAVNVSWFEIVGIIRHDARAVYEITPRKWEEIIAGAYTCAGFDEVILTPSSSDKGRDVVATKRGVGSIRIFDQVKAYRPGHLVTAEEVRALLGVITGAQNVSKGVLTTTSAFAPRLAEDRFMAPYMPHRLELKPLGALLSWLDKLVTERFGMPAESYALATS